MQVLTRALRFDQNLTEKSNSQLYWHTRFNPDDQAVPLPIPTGPWAEILRSITFFTHQNMTPLDVTRYATHATASLRNKTKQQAHVNFRWVEHGEPVGVGVRQWVDGARLRFTLPPNLLTRPFSAHCEHSISSIASNVNHASNMTRLPLTGSTSAIWLRLRGNWSHSRLWQILSRN